MKVSSSTWAVRLGFWSAFSIAVLFVSYTVCYVVVTLTTPVITWTTLSAYAASPASSGQLFKSLAQLAMLFFPPTYILLLNSLHDLTSPDRIIFARLSIQFGLIFTLCASAFYFVQLSTVRLGLASGQISGLEQFIQANPYSGMAAMNMLGWSLFFGVSSLFAAALFSGSGLEKSIRVFFLINGFSCLVGGFGYVFQILPLVLICMTFLMGGSVLVISILLCILFLRQKKMMVIS